MGKKKSAPAAKGETDSLPFEEALSQLDQIVCDLEDGSVGLEESMRRFETGIKLLRSCHEILERAEQKIELLTGFDADKNPVNVPFDTTATAEQANTSPGKRKSEARKTTETDESHDEDIGTLF